MNKHLVLERNAYLPFVTLGRLFVDHHAPLVTLENPWLSNQPYISCIPEGHYLCRRRLSPKFGDTYEVMNVPGRSHIIFHAGNTAKDTEGCILVANKLSEVQYAIVESRSGLSRLFEYLAEDYEFRLTVRSYRPAFD